MPYAPKDLAEARIAREVGSQNDRICEHPDEVLGLDLIAIGDHRSDRDVVMLRVAVQKALKRGEQGHEHRDAAISAQ